ncbi:hypothetical protein [Alkalimarinus alittae]|uniref:Uncharacterized protein n=1 Tax=Alkalimarinus alittae TaxID=2961619 RepID=A0ABY6N3R1_9ALTE|nr:hypothetical protein [Alkalimarinus alittae]UZE96645.1 hypothetical protein NKI27_02515 [Alkalimarinus alittae]
MIYLTVDGMFSGTGIRDSVEGGYLKLEELNISDDLKNKITYWLSCYEDAHYSQYEDESEVASLDSEGLDICIMLRSEIPDSKVEYYSSAEMKKIAI